MKYNVSKKIKLIIVNSFTVARLIGALFLPYIYIVKGASICAFWTIVLFLTDAIDGFLARTLKISTFFGSGMDGLSDKILNTISFILLGLSYSIMIPPLIFEICILLTIYSTYRLGGNIKSTLIGKIKTVILDICVIGSFLLLSLETFNISSGFINYLTNFSSEYIIILGCICSISEIIALLDYRKINNIARCNPYNVKVKNISRVKKTFKEVMRDAFDTEYYLKHKNEPIMKQFYKEA